MKIRYSEFNSKKGSVFKEGYTEKMQRCYENYNERTGEYEDYNHCGSAYRHNTGFFVCPNAGNLMKICGYMGVCGNITKPKALEETQLSFF